MRVKLKDICTPKQWKTIATNNLKESGYPVYGANGVIGYYDEYNHETDTLLVTCRGATCGSLNISKGKAYINGNAMALDNLREDINIKYLYYYLKSRGFSDVISGSAQPQIIRSAIEKIEINILSIEEQNRIVKKCEIIEKMSNNNKKLLNYFDTLIKARFVEMFGDPIYNEKGWKKKKLSEKCKIITGNTPSRKNKKYYGDYIEWIKSDNINTPNIYLTKANENLSEIGAQIGRTVDKGAILMTCIAGSLSCIGNVAIADRKVSFNQQINAIIPNDENPYYLYALFELTKKELQGSVDMMLKGIVSKSKLESQDYIFPPIELQNQFATFVQHIDKLKFDVQKSLEKTQMLFDSLMQEYFG